MSDLLDKEDGEYRLDTALLLTSIIYIVFVFGVWFTTKKMIYNKDENGWEKMRFFLWEIERGGDGPFAGYMITLLLIIILVLCLIVIMYDSGGDLTDGIEFKNGNKSSGVSSAGTCPSLDDVTVRIENDLSGNKEYRLNYVGGETNDFVRKSIDGVDLLLFNQTGTDYADVLDLITEVKTSIAGIEGISTGTTASSIVNNSCSFNDIFTNLTSTQKDIISAINSGSGYQNTGEIVIDNASQVKAKISAIESVILDKLSDMEDFGGSSPIDPSAINILTENVLQAYNEYRTAYSTHVGHNFVVDSGSGAGVKKVSIENAGSGYTTGVATTLSSGSGTDLTVDITVDAGTVTNVTIINKGQDYVIGDEITINRDGDTGDCTIIVDEIILEAIGATSSTAKIMPFLFIAKSFDDLKDGNNYFTQPMEINNDTDSAINKWDTEDKMYSVFTTLINNRTLHSGVISYTDTGDQVNVKKINYYPIGLYLIPQTAKHASISFNDNPEFAHKKPTILQSNMQHPSPSFFQLKEVGNSASDTFGYINICGNADATHVGSDDMFFELELSGEFKTSDVTLYDSGGIKDNDNSGNSYYVYCMFGTLDENDDEKFHLLTNTTITPVLELYKEKL